MPTPFFICIPSDNLSARARRYKDEFISNHLLTNHEYPVTKVFSSLLVAPSNPDALEILLQRGAFNVNATRIWSNYKYGTTEPVSDVSAVFETKTTIDNIEQTVRYSIFFPSLVSANITRQGTGMAFEFSPPLSVTILEKPIIGGVVAPLADYYDLLGVRWTDDVIDWMLQETSAPESQVIIKLDLANNCSGTNNILAGYLSKGGPASLSQGILSDSCCLGCGGGNEDDTGPTNPNEPPETQTICADSPIPAGYIKVNTDNNIGTCGSPSSIFIQNVWIIRRYDNKPVNSTLDVCADSPTPADWVNVGTHNDILGCGRPSSIFTQNVKTIKRIR